MGIYDSQIYSLRKKIERCHSQIRELKSNIRELEEVLEKCGVIDSRVTQTMNNIFQGIDSKKTSLEGNFVSYYKKQIEEIAKTNGIYDISSETSSDKRKIKNKIISCEEQIQRLYRQINSLESELAYYQANNIEPEE